MFYCLNLAVENIAFAPETMEHFMAKTILVEEYPDAERYLIPTDDDDVWILDTQIYRMEGLGRFYMGLKGYARKYSKDHIE